jgi:hypothetical protein
MKERRNLALLAACQAPFQTAFVLAMTIGDPADLSVAADNSLVCAPMMPGSGGTLDWSCFCCRAGHRL